MSAAANPAGNRRDLLLLIFALDCKARAAGFDGLSLDAQAELLPQLAAQETAFDILDDYEARLGLDVAEERAALVDLFVNANGDAPVLVLS